jgi:hypothetical protein
MTAVYDKLGIRFLYPENWQLSDERAGASPHSVSVLSPSGALWSVDLHRSSVDAESLAGDVLKVMGEEYSDLEAEPATELIGEFAATGYDMSFYCMDLLVSARLRALRTDMGAMVLLFQAEDRDFERLEPVFRAINLSLLSSPQDLVH